jgi:hypothetical protein
MNRLILCALLCFLGSVPITAISQDSTSAPIAYSEQDLYPLEMLSPNIWESQFSEGIMRVYNPTQLSASEWSLFKARTDSRILYSASQRPLTQNAYFVLLMAAWLGLSMLIYKNQQYFKSMLAALFNHRLALQFAREQTANRTAGSVLYLLIFNVLLAMLLMQFIQNREVYLSGWRTAVLLPGILVGVTAIYFFKYVFYKVIGTLFGMRELVSNYLSQVFLINRLLAPALLLLLAFVYYAPEQISKISLYSALVVIGLSIIWRYVFAIRQVTNVMVAHVFHFILYFCAVELIPTAVIAKFLLHV